MSAAIKTRRWAVSAAVSLVVALGASGPALTAENATYTYDALGRLATVRVVGAPGYQITYTYDAAGNRTSKVTTLRVVVLPLLGGMVLPLP
jgi:YD repeat-containing protein